MKVKKLVGKQVLHEIQPGKHRVVIIEGDQVTYGGWSDLHILARFNELYACSDPASAFGRSVFRVVKVEAKVLA